MDGEQVVLTASGYPWSCPDCKTENYLATAKRFITCSTCGGTFEVETLVHNIGVSAPRNILLTPASYTFTCTQCGQDNYIPMAAKTVKCRRCNAILEATGLRHKTLPSASPIAGLEQTEPSEARSADQPQSATGEPNESAPDRSRLDPAPVQISLF